MINNIKPGYVNPLKMMKKDGQTNPFNSGGMKKAEKRRKELEAEKQSLQNSLLLMKGTSGDAGASEESIKVLEKKLEEITKEIQSGRKTSAGEWRGDDVLAQESGASKMRRNFDWYSKSNPQESSEE